MKVPSAARGKRVKCPKCSTILTVPAAETPLQTEPDDDLFGGLDDDGGLLDDLAAAERSAEALAQPNLAASAPPPPAEFTAFPPAGLPAGGAAPPTGVVSRLGGLGRATGRLALGCLLCGIAAVIGTAAWGFLAIVLDVQIGLLAWAIGGLTGFAMALGHRQPSLLAGGIAAGMSFLAIIAAKILIFAFVIYVVVTGDTGDVEFQRVYVAGQIANEILDERGVDGFSERQEQWEGAWNEAKARADQMGDATLQQKWEEFRAADEQALVESGEPDASIDYKSAPGDEYDYAGDDAEFEEWDAEDAGGSAVGMFAAMMFRPLDLLFFLLAIVTAFKVGSGGFGAT